jgi:hypothetical protein
LRIRKILGNHGSLLRDRDILFLEERLRKGQGNICGIRKEHRKRLGKGTIRKGQGNICGIVATRTELGSFVRKRIRKRF